jgi:hypothetical protein
MEMPGFTAGASLYKTEGHYYTRSTSNQVRAAILPALGAGDGAGGCLDNCTSKCDNLDGIAYQRCVTRCGHICFPTGQPPAPLTLTQCYDNFYECKATCNFFPFGILSCGEGCDTTLCKCLVDNGTLPPGTVLEECAVSVVVPF